MVRQPSAADAAELARRLPRLAVGLHLDFGEWVYRDGEWAALYEVAPTDDPAAAAAEAERQLAAFRDLVGRDPTHLDSHQHVHRDGPLRSVVARLSESLAVPARHVTPAVRYAGDFYGQSAKGEPAPESIGVPALVGFLAALTPGVTELACHPGEDANLDSVYRDERLQEVRALCDPGVHETIDREGIRLVSFAEVRALLR